MTPDEYLRRLEELNEQYERERLDLEFDGRDGIGRSGAADSREGRPHVRNT